MFISSNFRTFNLIQGLNAFTKCVSVNITQERENDVVLCIYLDG